MMKRSFHVILSVVLLAACTTDPKLSGEEHSSPESLLMTKVVGDVGAQHRSGELLVEVDAATAKRIESEGLQCVAAEVFSSVEIYNIELAIRHLPKNNRVAKELGLDRWYIVTFDGDTPVESFAERVAMRSEISHIQFNSVPELAWKCEAVPFVPMASINSEAESAIPFNDQYGDYQWNLVNTGDKRFGQTTKEGADVGVKDAWTLTAGTPDVIVAVCDAPIKYTHPDLAAAMWINEGEVAGDGIDNDGNGFVDDIHGYNFITEGYSYGAINWDGDEGHGTHVAGIIGAVNGNGIGVSSVAGGTGNGDGVRLMSCQIFEGNLVGGDRECAEALIYAADNGACIAQCSYGYNASVYSNDNAYINSSPLEYRALKYFMDPENANHPSLESNIAIYSSGNEQASNSDYPGALSICVSVTAIGPDYLPAWYTNYGRGCNIAAPGGDHTMTSNDASMILSTCISETSSEYAYMQGTSMACPHVSGVAALGVSYAGKLGKRFTAEEFTSLLLTSVNDINQFLESGTKGEVELKQYYKRMGTGAIDAWKFLMQIEGTPSIMVRMGKPCSVNLKEYFGEAAEDITYLTVEVSDEAKSILGLTSTPKVKSGVMDITTTKNGSAKIRVSAIAGGGQLGGGNNIGGTEIMREVSIISRGVYSENGGWF